MTGVLLTLSDKVGDLEEPGQSDDLDSEDQYAQAIREAFGTVDINGQPLDFYISVQAQRVGSHGWRRVEEMLERNPDDDRLKTEDPAGEAFAFEVEQTMSRLAPDFQWRGPRRGPADTAGPGEDILLIAGFFGAALFLRAKAMGQIGSWIESGRSLRSSLPQVHEAFEAEPHIASGTAMMLGAAAVADDTGRDDFDFSFSTRMGAHPPNEWGEHDGFVVGFRGSDVLRIVALDLKGAIRGKMALEVPGRLPAWWHET